MKTILDFLKNDVGKEELFYTAENLKIYKKHDQEEEYSIEEKVKILENFINEIVIECGKGFLKDYKPMICEFEPLVSYYEDEKEYYRDFSCIYPEDYLEYLEQDKYPNDIEPSYIGFSPIGADILETVHSYISPYALYSVNKADLAYTILFELTWFGFDLETVNAGIKELKKSLSEVEIANPDSFKSYDEVKKDLGVKNLSDEDKEKLDLEFRLEQSENMKIIAEYREKAYNYAVSSEEDIWIFQPKVNKA